MYVSLIQLNYNRHRNETVTVRRHVTKYKNMLKLIVEFLRKFVSHGIKIAHVNNLIFNFVYGVGPV